MQTQNSHRTSFAINSFLAGFNAYGGMKAMLSALMKWVASGGADLHRRLAAEIRAVVKEKGPIVTKVFDNPDEFIGDRFVGEGEKLIKYVYWSNGRETDDPTAENKQCPGKDLVVLLGRLMVVEFFLKFDTFEVEIGRLLLGSSVTFKSLTMASS